MSKIHAVSNACFIICTDWNDGIALATLIDTLAPGLIADYKAMDKARTVDNCHLCMRLAQEYLGIPMLMTPQELSHPATDDLAVITYISFFVNYGNRELLQWLQAKLPEQGITNLTMDWNNGMNLAFLVNACSPGVHPDLPSLHPRLAPMNIARSLEYAHDCECLMWQQSPYALYSSFKSPTVTELSISACEFYIQLMMVTVV